MADTTNVSGRKGLGNMGKARPKYTGNASLAGATPAGGNARDRHPFMLSGRVQPAGPFSKRGETANALDLKSGFCGFESHRFD